MVYNMANYFENSKKELCCGCRACEQKCPQQCIKLVQDKEGFSFPEINKDLCISCDLCKKVCPINSDNIFENKFDTECYAAVHRNKDIVMNSTSGGAFTGIAEVFCDNNYAIFGASYDENLNVCHKFVENIEDINIFRKSKYVQSEVGDSYTNVKKFLNEGKKVLFSGTPCQVGGLNNFLGKKYNNLLTVDIICNGVPSPKVFLKYLQLIGKNDKVLDFVFRDKAVYWGKIVSAFVTTKFSSGKIITKIKDQFKQGFYNAIFHRDVCYNCPFTTINRVSDITISDFWFVEKNEVDFPSENGASMLLINTQKGNDLLQKLNHKMIIKKSDINIAIKTQPRLSQPIKFNLNRESFMNDLDILNAKDLFNKYIPMPSKLLSFASSLVSPKIKAKIIAFIRKIKK